MGARSNSWVFGLMGYRTNGPSPPRVKSKVSLETIACIVYITHGVSTEFSSAQPPPRTSTRCNYAVVDESAPPRPRPVSRGIIARDATGGRDGHWAEEARRPATRAASSHRPARFLSRVAEEVPPSTIDAASLRERRFDFCVVKTSPGRDAPLMAPTATPPDVTQQPEAGGETGQPVVTSLMLLRIRGSEM